MGVYAIAIVLGDNDFINTVRPLMETVKRVIEYNGELTSEEATRVIQDGIAFHYRAFQNLKRGNSSPGTLGYLHCQTRILFDAEACADMMKDRDGGAVFLDVRSGEILMY